MVKEKIKTNPAGTKKKPTKLAKKQVKNKLNERGTFFIRDEEGVYIVSKAFLKSLTFDQAVEVGLATLVELRLVLIDDAHSGNDTLIENIKAITGLNNSLSQIELRFPDIMKHIRMLATECTEIYTC